MAPVQAERGTWMAPIPRLETERLVLRGHQLEDFDECFKMWSDLQVTRYTIGRPSTREEAWARLLRNAGHWALLGFGYWVVQERSSSRFLGEVGLADLRRDLEPSFGNAPEAGWVLCAGAWGRGHATEAMRAVLEWGGANLRSERTVCMIHPENLASLKVATKCGFQEVTRTTYRSGPTVLFERALSPGP